jgi:uncharacterized membrane protein YfcA
LPKVLIFGLDGLFTIQSILIGIGLGIISIVGAFLGKMVLGRIPAKVFTTLITVILLVSGVSLIVNP